MPVSKPIVRPLVLAALAALTVLGALMAVGRPARGVGDHLVISEVVTGGASASDELIELYNPTAAPLPLEGLELIYASATGMTVTRRASWALGAALVQPAGHVLVANEAGIYAGIADATYASGMAATGGSVALRILGASTAIDAVGWGSATSTWREGSTAVAPAAGASIERRPGGGAGSGQDTDDNAADFVERLVPDPQNLASAPIGGQPLGSALPTPQPTPQPTAAPTDPPGPAVVPIGTARALPDGTPVTVEGVALTGSAFHDGGGFVSDPTGGIAVLVDGAAFGRGSLVRVTGSVEDRFAQRTLRVDAGDLVVIGADAEPGPREIATSEVAEGAEGSLVRLSGTIVGGRTELAAGVAYDFDDGSGATRLIVTAGSGIDDGAWSAGTPVTVVGLVGQRDSSGTGASGYRLMLRDAADVISVGSPPSPTPAASGSASGEPSPSAAPDGTATIAAARAADRNARLTVRGVVTLPPGVVDPDTAVIQDSSAAIVIRLGGAVGTLRLGDRVELSGTRSTKSGMETLRVTEPAIRLGTATRPDALALRTGDAAEEHEARLVTVRGSLVGSPRRSSIGSVSFEVDDGSGSLKVVIGAGIEYDRAALTEGTWVEVIGVLGQETTGSAPTSGYRVWPATAASVRVTAAPGGGSGSGGSGGNGTGGSGSGAPTGGLDDVADPGLGALRVGATLVAGPWPELGVAGLLWDGRRLVAIDDSSAVIVRAVLAGARLPVPLDLGGLAATGVEPVTGISRVALGQAPGDVLVAGAPSAPTARPRSEPAWASMIGLVLGSRDRPVLLVPGGPFRIEHRCADEEPRRGFLAVTGIAIDRPDRLLVGCGGMRRVPILRRAGMLAPMPAGSNETGAPPPVGPVPAERRYRPLAAGMLAFIAFGLAGGTAIVRLRRGPETPDDDPASGDGASAEPAESLEPPRLALVKLTRDGGP